MPVDDQIEPRVREIFAAAVTQDASRLESAIRAFTDDEALTAGVRLSAAIGMYVLREQYGETPGEEELSQLATEIAGSEKWAGVHVEEIMTYLTAGMSRTSFERVLPADRFALLTCVVAACLVSYFHRPGEMWWAYLDRAEAALEAAR
jgi:hypothetical protein